MKNKKVKLANSYLGGGVKLNKAFTLIELLAIIVILAIIAVITIPIILNVVDNAKRGSVIDSAYGYKDAIHKFYVQELYEDQSFKLDGTYTVTEDGLLAKGTEEHTIPTSGTTPSGGWVSIENNETTYFCLTMGDYSVKLKNGEVTAEKGECKFGGKVITNATTEKIPATGHENVKAIVYLDPTDLTTKCDADIAKNNVIDGSPTGVKTGCMKWYAFEEDDNSYKMILDHNTTAHVAWISQDDYNQTASKTATPSQVGLTYYSDEVAMTEDGNLPAGTWNTSNGTNNRGPITLLKQLQEDTKNWVAVETLTEDDTYTAEWEAEWESCSWCSDFYNGHQKYTINYNGYKARLISGEEINKITGKGDVTISTIEYGYFDSNCSGGTCSKGTNKYGWLFDHTGTGSSKSCESNGCNSGLNSDPMYWTLSPRAVSFSNAWGVHSFGRLDHYYVNNSTAYYGLRPVIKVSKSNIVQ